MGKLSPEQQKQFEELQAALDAPDEPESNRSVITNVTVDLSNPDSVKNARRFGFLPGYTDDDPDPDRADDGDGDGDGDDEPDQGGFFGKGRRD